MSEYQWMYCSKDVKDVRIHHLISFGHMPLCGQRSCTTPLQKLHNTSAAPPPVKPLHLQREHIQTLPSVHIPYEQSRRCAIFLHRCDISMATGVSSIQSSASWLLLPSLVQMLLHTPPSLAGWLAVATAYTAASTRVDCVK
jgi:hypothetical protein